MSSRPIPPDPDLLVQHAGFVRALARGLLTDSSEADDVVQETWLAAMTRPPRHAANLRGWLGTVARNFAFQRNRSGKRRSDRERRAARPDRLPSAAELAERMELQRRLLAELESLPEPFRSTLHYRYFDDLTPTEIAERLDIPVKTVKSRLRRALEKLRVKLDARHGGDRSAWSAVLLPLALPTAPMAGLGGVAATGGMVFTMKKAIALLAALLLITGAVVWRALPEREAPTPRRSTADLPEASSPRRSTAGLREDPGVATAPEIAPTAQVLAADDEIPPFTFAGRVVDPEGRGVSGAEVRLFYWAAVKGDHAHIDHKTLRREQEAHEAPSLHSGARGYFRFDRPYSSRSYLMAVADGFQPAVTAVQRPGGFTLIELDRAELLRVKVLDPDDKPVANTTVRLATASGGDAARHILAEAETDSTGTATLPVAGDADLRVEADPADPALGFAESAADPEQREVEIRVPAVDAFECRIVDAQTGGPVPGAYIMNCRGGERGLPVELRRFAADDRGRVRLPRPRPGWSLHATAPGYEVLPAGKPLVRIGLAMVIEGVVLDERGRPVPDAAILVANPPGYVFMRAHSGLPVVAAWSDAEGKFRFDTRSLSGLRRRYALQRAVQVDAKNARRAGVLSRWTGGENVPKPNGPTGCRRPRPYRRSTIL